MTNQERLAALRAAAMEERDPTCSDDVLSVLLNEAERVGAKHILEIGTGRGLTSIVLLLATDACVTTIERDQARIAAARENFALFGVSDRVTLLEGDAADILPCSARMQASAARGRRAVRRRRPALFGRRPKKAQDARAAYRGVFARSAGG